MESLHGPIAYGIIILVVVFLIIILLFVPSPEKKEDRRVENYMRMPSNFLLFNYFPKHQVQVEIVHPDFQMDRQIAPVAEPVKFYTVTPTPLATVKPLKTEGITRDKVEKYLKPGTLLRFYVINNKGDKQHYSDYIVNTRDNERIKNLHIGMITTRFSTSGSDSLHLTTTSANAGQGSAWLVIHNTTNLPLVLNDGEIQVDPHSTFRYLGYLNQGVTLGTYFRDSTGLYPEYQLLQPYTDLYYGIISDLQQPLNGCLQYDEFNDQCEYGETIWPFVEGIY